MMALTGDVIARCVVDGGAARVVIVLATGLAREGARRHDARGAAALALARAGVAGLLLATLTKGDERVTLQLLGNGALSGLTVDASAEGTARMFVGNPHLSYLPRADGPRPLLAGAVGTTGIVSVVRDLGLRDQFRGQTSFLDGEIDTDVERYLLESEQIDSALGCEVFLDGQHGVALAAGILVQALPGGRGAELVALARSRLRAGRVAEALAAQLGDLNAPPVTTDAIARATLDTDAETLVQLGDLRPLRFFCPCSRERAAVTLAMLGERELLSMIEEDGQGRVTCEFCRQSYEFTDRDLEGIRRGISSADAPPS